MLLPLKCLADIILHEILNLMDLEIHFALIAKATEKQHSMYGNNHPFRSRIQKLIVAQLGNLFLHFISGKF